MSDVIETDKYFFLLIQLVHGSRGQPQFGFLCNQTIKMKMLDTRKPTSPNKLYFTPRPNFMSTREDRETSTPKRNKQEETISRARHN